MTYDHLWLAKTLLSKHNLVNRKQILRILIKNQQRCRIKKATMQLVAK